MDWIYLAQDTDKLWDFVRTATNIRATQNSGKFLDTLRNCQLFPEGRYAVKFGRRFH